MLETNIPVKLTYKQATELCCLAQELIDEHKTLRYGQAFVIEYSKQYDSGLVHNELFYTVDRVHAYNIVNTEFVEES